jgi:hypothetical protein
MGLRLIEFKIREEEITMSDHFDYERDVNIDETSLDIEWLDQPRLMLRYTRHLAEMEKRLDQAKENLDVVKAELDRMVRSKPEDFAIQKVTEAVVQNTILEDSRYLKANQGVIEAKYELNIAKGAVKSMEQRKDALENMVRLHGQQYFAGPRVPRNLTEERQAKQKKADTKIKMQRRGQ